MVSQAETPKKIAPLDQRPSPKFGHSSSLSVATRTGAVRLADFTKVIVNTAVPEKAVAFPTDASLCIRRERLVAMAKKHGVALRQSYERIVSLR